MSPSLDQRENREFATELKFRLPRPVADQVREWARSHLAPDPHAVDEAGDGYTISSLYFDTAGFDVFQRRGSFGRSKFRIRRYGCGELAFLERKLKTRGLVAKRRSEFPVPQLRRLMTDCAEQWRTGQWFHDRLSLRRLHPVCQIQYRRTARIAATSRGPIRLTLDDQLRSWPRNEADFAASGPGVPLLADSVILELKYRLDTPVLFKRLIEEFALSPVAVSKYRLAIETLGLAPKPVASEPARFGDGRQQVTLCLTS